MSAESILADHIAKCGQIQTDAIDQTKDGGKRLFDTVARQAYLNQEGKRLLAGDALASIGVSPTPVESPSD